MKSEWIKTHCARFDHGGCGLKVLVENGVAVKVLPDATNPVSKGWVCAKGLASLERIRHPDRLCFPLRREGRRGEGRWKKISWDEALSYAAEKFTDIKTRYGVRAVAFAQGAPKGLEFLMLMRLANTFGSPVVAGTQHVCHMPRELTGRITCGYLPVPDYEAATKCVLLWGSNPLANNEEGILGIHLKQTLKKDNALLIVIDPLGNEIARSADLWLQIKPGTDDYLALGMLHIIIKEKWFDHDFVAEWTAGFEALKAHVRTYSPEMVSEKTWIPKEQIITAAKMYAASKPALLHWGNAVENNGINTSQTCRAINILMAITGNLDVPGGNIQPPLPEVMSLRKFTGLDHIPAKEQKPLNRHHGISTGLPLAPSSLLINAILHQSPFAVKSLFIQASNPMLSYAGSEKVRQALEQLDFLMVSDLFMTPTAAMADLVLPAATNMEYNDIGHYGLPHGYVLARPKVMAPRKECWPDIKILNELGKRLGLETYFWDNIEQCLADILAPSGLSYRQFCEQGILKGEKQYFKYKKGGFKTPSGKVELFSSVFEKQGYAPLPSAQETEATTDNFPLLMINRKPKYFFHSGYRHIDSLRKKAKAPGIKIHPETASAHEIAEGDAVILMTQNGRIVLTAQLTDAVHPKVVMADYGCWFPEQGVDSLYGWKEANVNMVTSGDPPYDPVLGTTPLRGIPCKIAVNK